MRNVKMAISVSSNSETATITISTIRRKAKRWAEFSEDYRLGLWVSGSRVDNNWAHPNEKSSVYELKAYVENILVRLGVNLQKVIFGNLANDIYSAGLSITTSSGRQLGTMGIVSPKICKETGY